MLTQKDFKAVADVIANNHTHLDDCDADYYQGGRYDSANSIAGQLADYFATQNPRFDRSRFMQACGLTE